MKRLFVNALAVVCAATAFAQTDGISVSDVGLAPGKTSQVAVALTNSTTYTAFQFDMVLPSGISIVKDASKPEFEQYEVSLVGGRTSDHKVYVAQVADNTYRFLGFSMTNGDITGNSGQLLQMTLQASSDVATGALSGANSSKSLLVAADNTQSQKDAEVDFAVNVQNKVTFTIGTAGKTTYCDNFNLDFTGNDLAAYVVTGYEKSDGTIWLTRVYDVPAGTPIYLKGAQGSYDVDISDASTSYYQNLMLGNNSSESLTVTSDATDQYYNVTASGFNIINGSKSIGAHKCYLRLPTTLPAAKAGSGQSVKITSAGKTTLCSDVDLDFSGLTNVKAYTATGYDKSDGTIWMTRVERASAGTPLYIKGDEGTWTIPSSAQQTYYANMLKGNNSDASLTINATDGEYTNHFLAASGFSTFEGTKAIGAHKSYLQILTSYLTSKAAARGMSEGFVIGEREGEVIALTLGAGDGETTGIKAVGEFEGDAEVIYNLNGQRVENPGKGLYIINGRKVVIK